MEKGAKQYFCTCGNDTFNLYENPPSDFANIITWDVDCTQCGKTRMTRSNYD